jgi:hypothetical protein
MFDQNPSGGVAPAVKLIKLAFGMMLIMAGVVTGYWWQVKLELNTQLCATAFSGHLEAVGSLIEEGADPDGTTTNRTLVGRSDYHPVIPVCGNWSRFQCPEPAILAAREGNVEIVRLLLARGSKCTLADFESYYDFHPR